MRLSFFSKLPLSGEKLSRISLLGCSLAVLALSACQQESGALSPEAATVQREQFYVELEQMEARLPEAVANYRYGRPAWNSRSWVRNSGVPATGEFEDARVRRIIALENLSEFQVPMEDDPDFSPFWEIHGAYVRAVQTARFGYGQVGLSYSRPYPADHVSTPFADVLSLQRSLEAGEGSGDIPSLLARLPEMANDLQNARRRLEFDSAAGISPPPEVLTLMIASMNTSAFRSEDSYAEWDQRWRAAEVEEMPYSDWILELEESVEPMIVPEVDALLATLNDLLQDWQTTDRLSTFSPDYYDAVISQATSGLSDAAACQADARRLSESTLERLNDTIELGWHAHAEIDEDGNRLEDGVAVPGNLLAALQLWQTRAPLVPPPPSETDLGEDEPSTPAPPPEPGPALPTSFVQLQEAIDYLEPYLSAYSVQRLPGLALTPVITDPTVRPAPAVPSRLYPEPRYYDPDQPVPLSVSVDYLNAHPVALSVEHLLAVFYPGHALRERREIEREDIPMLARRIHSAAFDYGWSLYAVSVLSQRGAFNDTPQLEAAMLYARLSAFTEAEAETGLLTGELSEADAINLMTFRLGISQSEALRRLNVFRVEPGLSCAALEGYLQFTRMRERAGGVLGNRLNIREFHNVLLEQGSRPLQLVERDVDDWIADQVN